MSETIIPTVGSNKYICKMEDQVCTLEEAKALREQGYPQNTYYYWQELPSTEFKASLLCGNRFPEDEHTKHYAAYTYGDMRALSGIGVTLPIIPEIEKVLAEVNGQYMSTDKLRDKAFQICWLSGPIFGATKNEQN